MDYPGNTNRAKDAPIPAKPPAAPPERKKVEAVVTGKVVKRKRPLGKRFKETFIVGDGHGVWNYVMMDVLVPAAKDAIADAVSTGIERLVFGESRSGGRRPSSRSGGSTYTPYNRYSPSKPEPRREVSPRSRATHDFGEIVLDSRAEAETVLDRLIDLISQYEQATVADMYDLVNMTGSFVDHKWGWRDLRGSGVTRAHGGGYVLDLPRPEELK